MITSTKVVNTTSLVFFVFLSTVSIVFAQQATVSTIQLSSPVSIDGITLAPDGTLYGADGFNGNKVFHIALDGTTSEIATGLNGPIDIDWDESGLLYVSTFNNKGLYTVDLSSGSVELFATVDSGPTGLRINRTTGKVYLSQYGPSLSGGGNSVHEVDLATGASNTLVRANGLSSPVPLALDEQGTVYAANAFNGKVFSISEDGAISQLAAIPVTNAGAFNLGHMTYANGALYVTQYNRNLIYRVSLEGEVAVLAGTGQAGLQDGAASEARFNAPNGITASVTGDTLYVAEGSNTGVVRMIVMQESSTDIDEEPLSLGASLHHYPNPVSVTNQASSQIGFSLATPSHTTVSVYDMLGRKRDTLLDRSLNAGSHTLTYDFFNLPPGIYFYHLRTGKHIETSQVIVY